MPSPHELVAHGRTEAEIAEAIGADLVIYQTIDDLVQSCRSLLVVSMIDIWHISTS
jgi:amidophosphoribosyltransferase